MASGDVRDHVAAVTHWVVLSSMAGQLDSLARARVPLCPPPSHTCRQEAEWLHHRTMNQRFEAERAGLRDAVEAAKRQAAEAATTAAVARDQTQDGREEVRSTPWNSGRASVVIGHL